MQAVGKTKTLIKRNAWSYAHTPQTKAYTYQSIVDTFRSNVKNSPHREILIHREPDGFRNSLTYLQLQEKSEHLAKYLINKGIQHGDVVGMFGANSCEWMIGELSILMAGGTAVHLNAGITSVDDNMEIMMLTNCKGLIVEPGRYDEFLPAIEKLISKMDLFWKENGIVIYLKNNNKNPDICLNTILLKSLNEDLSSIKIHPHDTAYLFTTSGSTGKPKMLKISHFSQSNIPDILMRNEDENSARIYCDRPFGWTGGNPTQFLLVKCAHVFCASFVAMDGKNTEAIWNITENEKCTQAMLLPYHIYDLISLNAKSVTGKTYYKLKSISVTGQMVSDNIMEVVGLFADSINNLYGTSEMLYISITENYSQGNSFETGFVGKPVPECEIKIMDENEDTVKLGEVGEIYSRSRLEFNGYFKNEEKTKNTFRKEGWVSTGDIGLIDEAGNLILKGRKTNIISRGTRKIFPASIEFVVTKMEGIEIATVVGVPDSRLLEEICVCYTTNKHFYITPDDVRVYCLKHFFQEQATDDGLGLMPKYFLELSKIPRLPNGKLDRSQVKSEAAKRLFLG